MPPALREIAYPAPPPALPNRPDGLAGVSHPAGNPAPSRAAIGTIIGCFQEKFPGKIQQGSAWWFNDHKIGMTDQMSSLANLGCFGNFIGMLTDSRSFLSYTRHDYFRRILCELVGGWVENGEYPADMKALEEIVKGICYNNAVKYFDFKLDAVK